MFWSENVGIISISRHPEEKIWWTLPNCFTYFDTEFSNVVQPCVVCSPLFSFKKMAKWRLVWIRNKSNQMNFVGIFLWRVSPGDSLLNVTIKLGILKAVGHDTISGDLNSYGCFGKWDFVNLACFMQYKDTYSKDGFIRVFCEMRLKMENLSNVPLKSEQEEKQATPEDDVLGEVPESTGVDKLVQDLKSLLLNGQQSDLTLKIEDREFKVHRSILIVRSPVFASMLQHDTKEKTTGIVDIPDCSSDAFEMFLSYVYTGKADAMSSDNMFDLYYAADKYQIKDLKLECLKYMEENLSVENFCDVMALSLQHSEPGLQKKATAFFCDNVKVIIKTVQRQNYVKEFPVEANELYIKAMNA